MSVKIKPTSVIIKRLGLDPNGRVQKDFTSVCAKHMDKYVPFSEGNLADYFIEGQYIVYHQPYAEYQYYGQRKDGSHKINPDNRDRSEHRSATSYWDKKMVTAEMRDIEKEMQELINRGGR